MSFKRSPIGTSTAYVLPTYLCADCGAAMTITADSFKNDTVEIVHPVDPVMDCALAAKSATPRKFRVLLSVVNLMGNGV